MRWVIAAFIALLAVPAQAEWRRAETPHYTIYSEGSEKSLRDFAVKVENFSAVMRDRFSAVDDPDQAKLTVFMLPNQAAVAKFAKSPNLAGYYSARPSGSFAVTHRDTESYNGQRFADSTLYHELVHHFLPRHTSLVYPAWLSEGLAEFYSTLAFDKAGIPSVGTPPYDRAYDIRETKAIAIEKLLGGYPNYAVRDEVGSFYARSWVLTHYLLLPKDRGGQLTRYLNAMQTGTASLEAAKAAFGDLAKLDDDIDAYIKKNRYGLRAYKQAFPVPTGITIETMSPAAGAFVPLRLTGFEMHHPEEGEAQVKALKAMLQKYPDEADGWRLLAEAELVAENYGAAETAADEALKRAPKLPRALLAKGWAMLQKADAQARTQPEDWKAARAWIVKANKETPNDPLILSRYYQSFIIEGKPLIQAAKDGLWRAYTLSPEEPNLRMLLAEHLFEEEKYDGAITLVAPLAYGPHQDQSTQQMQRFIERTKRRKAGLTDEEESKPGA